MFPILNSCQVSEKYGRISREDLEAADKLVSSEKAAVSLYIFPEIRSGCLRKSVLSYPSNPVFKQRVSFQEWAQFTSPLMHSLDDQLSVCTSFVWYLLEPCICLLHCPITRGSYKKLDTIPELNAFYEFLDEINSKLLNFRNMEARLLITETVPEQSSSCLSAYPSIPEHQLRIVIHIFNSPVELKAFPRPRVGVTAGYPHLRDLLYCLWQPCPVTCCLSPLDYRLQRYECVMREPMYVSGDSVESGYVHRQDRYENLSWSSESSVICTTAQNPITSVDITDTESVGDI